MIDLNTILNVAQLIIAVGLIALIMLQPQDPGFYSQTTSINKTKRGTEKLIFNLTIVVSILFVAISLTNFLI